MGENEILKEAQKALKIKIQYPSPYKLKVKKKEDTWLTRSQANNQHRA